MTTGRLGLTLLAGLALACSGADDDAHGGSEKLLEPPTDGVQFEMKTTIDPGSEVEHCKFFQLEQDLYVNSQEVRYTSGSHHVLLFRTPYTEIPTETEAGEPRDTDGVFDCSEGVFADYAVNNVVSGSQSPDAGGSALSFPDDVAITLKAGTVLLMNAHYINTSAKPLEPTVAINQHSIPKNQAKHEGGAIFWYNPFIRVPAKSKGAARMSCAIDKDITLLNVQSHMHARGVNYEAKLEPANGKQVLLYENTHWEDVPVKHFKGGKAIEKGSRIEYMCEYQNDDDHTVYQGPRTTDEMCMLVGSYYPRDVELETCAHDGNRFLGADWVGNGTKSCTETMTCIQGAQSAKNPFQAIMGCVDASCAKASKPMSTALRCFMTADDPVNDCGEEIATCAATQCD